MVSEVETIDTLQEADRLLQGCHPLGRCEHRTLPLKPGVGQPSLPGRHDPEVRIPPETIGLHGGPLVLPFPGDVPLPGDRLSHLDRTGVHQCGPEGLDPLPPVVGDARTVNDPDDSKPLEHSLSFQTGVSW